MTEFIIEAIGWISTLLFLVSIVVPSRKHLHQLGILASITTGVYAYSHGATAIWVKWLIAFFFHVYMLVAPQLTKESFRKWPSISDLVLWLRLRNSEK